MTTTIINGSASGSGSTGHRIAAAWVAADPLERVWCVSALAATALLGLSATDPVVGAGLFVSGAALAVAALVDLAEQRLPNVLVLVAALVALVAPAAAGDLAAAGRAVAGGLVAGVALLTVRIGRGLGMGDVKAGAAVGASCGGIALVLAPTAVAVAAGAAATYGLMARRQRVALGPWLWLGWAAALAAHRMGVIA